jgi:hypothetical protein
VWHRVAGDRADNIEQSIAAARNAQSVVTREKSSSDWSAAQSALGAAYSARVLGSRADNLEIAIAAYEQALSVVSRERAPACKTTSAWPMLRAFLDSAATMSSWRSQRLGEPFARETSPGWLAQVQMNLANAYLDRTAGLWSQNRQTANEANRRAVRQGQLSCFSWVDARMRIQGRQIFNLKRRVRLP